METELDIFTNRNIVSREAHTQFKPDVRDVYIKDFAWMDLVSQTTNVHIEHFRNTGYEIRIGKYPVDGFCSQTRTVYQFHGCYHHGHSCAMTVTVKNKDWHGSSTLPK